MPAVYGSESALLLFSSMPCTERHRQWWKEFDVSDRAARRAAGLENAEVVQQTLIHVSDEDFDSQVIDLNLVPPKE
jgi:hypothetical protein